MMNLLSIDYRDSKLHFLESRLISHNKRIRFNDIYSLDKHFGNKNKNLSVELKILSIVNHVEFFKLKRFHTPLKLNNNVLADMILNRSVLEIMRTGFIGCTDLALVCKEFLTNAGYDCRMLFAVSEQFSSKNNEGHTFLLIYYDNLKYVIDCSLKSVARLTGFGYLDSIKIASIHGDLFVFAECFDPKDVNLHSLKELSDARTTFFHSIPLSWRMHQQL